MDRKIELRLVQNWANQPIGGSPELLWLVRCFGCVIVVAAAAVAANATAAAHN